MNKNPIKKGDILNIYTDGAARGNPGPAACAFLFVHNKFSAPVEATTPYLLPLNL